MTRTVLPCSLALLALAAAPARADDLLWHINAGVEIAANASVSTTALRGRALVGTALGRSRVRPAIAAGFTASAANAYTGGELPSAHVQTFGAETELGLQLYARDGAPTTWIFASATYAGRSERGSLGVNFARTEARHWSCPSKNRCNAVVGLLAPQQLEIVVETDAGLPRYGGMFSWGI